MKTTKYRLDPLSRPLAAIAGIWHPADMERLETTQIT